MGSCLFFSGPPNKHLPYFCIMSIQVDTSRIQFRPVTVTFLEMHDKKEMPAPLPGTAFRLLPEPVSVDDYREYYYGVGEKHFWLDRIVMPDEELFEKINAPDIDIYVFSLQGQTAGFVEYITGEKFVEILYFGLLPHFIGKGLGKYFLEWVIGKAWSYGPAWIQLNTCTLDHPQALPNYVKAGFVPVRTETHQRRILV